MAANGKRQMDGPTATKHDHFVRMYYFVNSFFCCECHCHCFVALFVEIFNEQEKY